MEVEVTMKIVSEPTHNLLKFMEQLGIDLGGIQWYWVKGRRSYENDISE